MKTKLIEEITVLYTEIYLKGLTVIYIAGMKKWT